MVGHYQRKWSSSAKWCERLAALGVPYFAITILLHRTGQITTPQVYWLIAIGALLPLASLFLGVRAFFDLWTAGHRGGKATLRGLIVSVAMLVPFLWLGFLSFIHPTLSDVATNPYSPPQFIEAGKGRAGRAGTGINPLANYDSYYAELLIESYPKLASRRYNSGAERILAAVRALIADRGWRVTATRGLPETAEPAQGETKTETEAGTAQGQIDSEAPADILIEAEARSLVFGFRQDVIIAIISEAETTLVDMRASTRWGPHDFGRNADTITRFLADLDKALVGIAGEG